MAIYDDDFVIYGKQMNENELDLNQKSSIEEIRPVHQSETEWLPETCRGSTSAAPGPRS